MPSILLLTLSKLDRITDGTCCLLSNVFSDFCNTPLREKTYKNKSSYIIGLDFVFLQKIHKILMWWNVSDLLTDIKCLLIRHCSINLCKFFSLLMDCQCLSSLLFSLCDSICDYMYGIFFYRFLLQKNILISSKILLCDQEQKLGLMEQL